MKNFTVEETNLMCCFNTSSRKRLIADMKSVTLNDMDGEIAELKKTYPDITLESAIPCETQAAKWNAAMRERYYGIAAQCDKETLLQTHYTPDCMDKRNRYMVDHADYIIAVWDGKPSGTGKTVMYAQSKGKVIIKVNPATLTVDRL